MAGAGAFEEAFVGEIMPEWFEGGEIECGEAGEEVGEVDAGVLAEAEDEGISGEERGGERDDVHALGYADGEAGEPAVQVGRVGVAAVLELRGGGGAEADPCAHSPRIQIMDTGAARAGVVGDFVLGVAGGSQEIPGGLVEAGVHLDIRADLALGELEPEGGVLLESEAIGGDVGGAKANGFGEVSEPLVELLAGGGED